MASKNLFLNNFVAEDDNELIDFDEQIGKIVKKTEKQLSIVDEFSYELISKMNDE